MDAPAQFSTLDQLERDLLARPLRARDEYVLQDRVEEVLRDRKIRLDREWRLSGRDRVDFFLPDGGVAIEVKLHFPAGEIFRQLARYSEHEAVKELALVAIRPLPLPPEINGKRVRQISLWKAVML